MNMLPYSFMTKLLENLALPKQSNHQQGIHSCYQSKLFTVYEKEVEGLSDRVVDLRLRDC